MISRYQRLEGEHQIDHLLRLGGIKLEENPSDLEWTDIVELCGFNCHYDSMRKALQPAEYGGYAIAKYLKEKYEKANLSDDKILKEYEIKKQEIQKEKVKVQTEKLTLNQALREEARFELFVERAVQAISELEPLERPEPIFTYHGKTEGLLCIADTHFDKNIVIKGLRGEILNEYNEEIFEKRMYELLDKTVALCEKESLNHIHIMNLGDEIEGMIRIGQLANLKYGVIESSIKFAYFIANWLKDLSKYVCITYYSTCGNHTDLRLLNSKKGDFPHENMSKVMYVLTKEILIDNPNITFVENETGMIFTEIAGFNILGTHGEEKDVQQAIRDYAFMYNEEISYLITGHKHHANSVNLGVSKGTIGVGSICGIDDFSMKLKKVSEPSSTFVVFEEGVGKTIEYNIALK